MLNEQHLETWHAMEYVQVKQHMHIYDTASSYCASNVHWMYSSVWLASYTVCDKTFERKTYMVYADFC